jgi:ATP-dependent Clp protease ATP-binding subunit ClpA
LKNKISPELLNRIDYKVIFKPLTKEELSSIFKINLAIFLKTWEQNPDVKLPKYSDKKIKEIIDKIYDPQY